MTVFNTITIREDAGVTTTNYPIQIGRPFVLGEIASFPQIVLSGTPLTTQADVKKRWGDGSVKHAILSFYIPTLTANSTIILTFQNQATGNNTGYETKTAMLSASYNFEATMVLTSGTVVSASARTMLNADAYSYWTSGTISTSIVIADHSVARPYDIGFDANKSIRPIFHATFWPLINKVKIRYIGEICNTECLQDQWYSLSLAKGNVSPTQFYTKSAVSHFLAGRWTKNAWIGTSATNISINHNVGYLASTNQIFNYDPSKVVSVGQISADYASWNSGNHDLYGAGTLQQYMPNTGGRFDLGPYPEWTVRWLYTGDYRCAEMAFGNADLGGAWPMHYREGKATKIFITGTSGLGKPVTIKGRPTIALYNLGSSDTVAGDKITPIASTTNDIWVKDIAHVPDIYSVQYLLTGDYWYLEQLYFWGSELVGHDNPYYRGPDGSYGGMTLAIQLRGVGWAFRTRSQVASLAPDNSPEKTYFESTLNDAIACWEGNLNISGTSFTGNAIYNWAVTNMRSSRGPLRNGMFESDPSLLENLDATKVATGTSTWMVGLMMLGLGRAYELGYATSALLAHGTDLYVQAVTNSSYTPYLLATYRMPVVELSTDSYYTDWGHIKSGFIASYQAISAFPLSDVTFGYDFIALAGASFSTGPGSLEVNSYMTSHILTSPLLNDDPKWALLARGPLTALTTSGGSGTSGTSISVFKIHKIMRIHF